MNEKYTSKIKHIIGEELIMSEDSGSADNYAADVFSGTVEGDQVSTDVGGLAAGPESWDDAESYEPIIEDVSNEAETEESTEEVVNDGAELFEKDSEEESAVAPEPDSEDSEESAEDSSEAEDEGEADRSSEDSFEIPQELADLGIQANEEGEVGKFIKIDGEDQFVSLTDLGNDYSGQKAISQKFNEIAQERTQHQNEVAEVNGYINTFGEKMKEGDSLSAMEYMGEFAGIPPYQIKRQLIEQLKPEIEKMYEMTAPELSAQYAIEENEYLKQSLESANATSSAQQAQVDLNTEISTIREAQGIEDTEWDQAMSYLREHETQLRADSPDLVMDAAYVADTVMDVRAYTKAETALTAANVDLSVESNSEIMSYLQDVAYRNPDFDNNDLVELVQAAQKSAVESKVSTSLGKRVAKNGTKQKAPEVKQQQTVSQEESAILDDIWD